jgi:hypothetical protein
MSTIVRVRCFYSTDVVNRAGATVIVRNRSFNDIRLNHLRDWFCHFQFS